MTSKTRKPPSIPLSEKADLSGLVSKRSVSPQEVRDRLAQGKKITPLDSLHIPNPGNAATGLTPNTMVDGGRYELPISKIRPYDRNPRKSSNASYEDIKSSLKATGPDNVELWITQRPGQEHYMPYRGGNTRLSAINALFEEGDLRWERLVFVYKSWISEADTLAQHLIENGNRADMSFWDKACAYLIDMRTLIEQEAGGPVSIRKLEEEFALRGTAVGKSLIAVYQFAVTKLFRVGPYLSATQVLQLQPAINLLAKLCAKFDVSEEQFQAELDAVCELLRTQLDAADSTNAEGSLRADSILSALHTVMATRIGATDSELRKWLDTLKHFSDAVVSDFQRSGDGSNNSSPPLPQAPAAPEVPPRKPEKPSSPSPAPSSTTPDRSAGVAETAPGTEVVQSGSGIPVTPPVTPVAQVPADVPRLPSLETPLEAVRALAQAAYVEDCLRVCPSMPKGFFIEVPNEDIDVGVECPLPSRRVFAWQLLAALSGQWDATTCRSLPTDSMWRRMRLCEGGLDSSALPSAIHDRLLTEVSGHCISPGANDLGWGPSVSIGWVVGLLTDPACANPVSALLRLFTAREVAA